MYFSRNNFKRGITHTWKIFFGKTTTCRVENLYNTETSLMISKLSVGVHCNILLHAWQ